MRHIIPLVILLSTGVLGIAQSPPDAHAPTTASEAAQTAGLIMLLKDGRTVQASALRRDGTHVMAIPMPAPPPAKPTTAASGITAQPASTPTAVPAGTVEIGYAVTSIAKIEFPEPAALKAAADLLLHAKPADALVQLRPVIQNQEPFRDIPGNWWLQAAQLKLTALISLERDLEVESLLQQLTQVTNNPETAWTVKVQRAAIETRKKNYDSALPVFEAAIAESKNPQTLAQAWLNKANILQAKRAFEPALLAYLHIPVLYPNQDLVMPQALAGSAHAYLGLGDQAAARRAFEEEISKYPAAPETEAVKAELEKLKTTNSNP